MWPKGLQTLNRKWWHRCDADTSIQVGVSVSVKSTRFKEERELRAVPVPESVSPAGTCRQTGTPGCDPCKSWCWKPQTGVMRISQSKGNTSSVDDGDFRRETSNQWADRSLGAWWRWGLLKDPTLHLRRQKNLTQVRVNNDHVINVSQQVSLSMFGWEPRAKLISSQALRGSHDDQIKWRHHFISAAAWTPTVK